MSDRMQSENMQPLDAWLDRVEASEQWTFRVPNTGADVTAYLINCQLVVVIRYKEHLGWEILVPSSKKNRIETSLDEAAIVLGVEGSRGLVDKCGAI